MSLVFMGSVKYEDEWRVSLSIGVIALIWLSVAFVRFRTMWWRCHNNIRVQASWGCIDTLLQPLIPDDDNMAPTQLTLAHMCWVSCGFVSLAIGVCMLFLYA